MRGGDVVKRLLEIKIIKVGGINELTLSKQSKPGDGIHACGVKGMSRT